MAEKKHESEQPGPSRPPEDDDEYLNPASEKFDPMRALYAPNLKQTSKGIKVYDNLAQFETALAKVGIYKVWDPKAFVMPSKSNSGKVVDGSDSIVPGRRFLPHQAPIPSTGPKKKHSRSLFLKIETITGPLALLATYMEKEQRVQVYTRKEKGVRGITTGILKAFDKHWNIVLEDACEVWKRRKYRYSEDTVCAGEAKDCSKRLRSLGIELPKTEVKSVHRKYVECTRRSKKLMIRGEQVVLITSEK